MAIEFTNVNSQNVVYSTDPFTDLTTKTIVYWIDLDSFGDTSNGAGLMSKGAWVFYIATSSERLVYRDYFTGDLGTWATAINTMTTGKHLVAVAYDHSSAANDPVFYIDGASSATTEVNTPTGSFFSDAAYDLTFGGFTDGIPITFKSPDGKFLKILVYNRILAATEIADIYNSRGASYPRNGLVFCPQLIGAAGLQVFDGTTLAACNTIVDKCSGALGVPNGNPIARGETYLSVK